MYLVALKGELLLLTFLTLDALTCIMLSSVTYRRQHKAPFIHFICHHNISVGSGVRFRVKLSGNIAEKPNF